MAASALETLIELSQTRMDDAAKRLGQLLASSQAHEEKLRMLEQYRGEYQNRFRTAVQGGIGPDALRNYSHFLIKLDEAIIEQQRIVEHAQAHVAAGRQSWVDERNRKKAFDTLAVRQQRIVQQREFKAEQRLTDEHSAKLFRRDADEE